MLADAKMSKSRGNVVSPAEMVKKFGIDTYRYFLLRDVTFGMDGSFSEDAIIKRFNGDLANDLGNSVYRTLTMVEKYFQGEVPKTDISLAQEEVKKIMGKIKFLPQEIRASLGVFNFSLALENIWGLINLINKHVEETKPWNLAKENKLEELKNFIRLLVEALRAAASALEPFLPGTSKAIEEQLGSDKTSKGNPLFPRIEIKK
jgi:methionyl-tRNA synthetase